VALVWAFEIEHTEAQFEEIADAVSYFDVVVVVADTLDFHNCTRRGWHVVAFPDADARERFGAGLDWWRYFERRIRALRRDVAPDFEFVLSTAPDSFLDVLKRPDHSWESHPSNIIGATDPVGLPAFRAAQG
jgi:hypothetical protein